MLIGLLTGGGCSDRAPERPRAVATGDSRESAYDQKLSLDSRAPDRAAESSSVRAYVDVIDQNTPSNHPAVVLFRENFETLFLGDGTNNLTRNLRALRNPEVARLLLEHYLQERSKGRFWKDGVLIIGLSGNKAAAPALLADFERLPTYVRPEKMGWGEMAAESIHPKSIAAKALFMIDDSKVSSTLLASFTLLPPGDQILIAKAAGESRLVSTAEQLVVLATKIATPAIEGELVFSANRIIYQVISDKSAPDSTKTLGECEELITEMKKRGYLHDSVANQIQSMTIK